MSEEFKIKKSISQKRNGLLKTKSGVVKTPVFMPIATKGAVKNLTPEELKVLGTKLLLGNTYHLWLRPGEGIIKKAGGLHEFMNWDGPILTDSGGYQVFSLENKIKNQKQTVSSAPLKSAVKVTNEGVEFRDPIDGKKYFLTPEKSIEIQLALGSDIIMVLDECPPYPCTRSAAEKAVRRTTEWAARCKERFNKSRDKDRLLFGIVQGSIYKDLRQKSAKELLGIGFDGYAIGGVAVGEPRKYLPQILSWVLPVLPEEKPRYLMGLGRPEEIVKAVLMGVDMFDCVIPTREARHGRIYRFKNKNFSNKKLFYQTIQVKSSKFSKCLEPIDKNCDCYTCRNYSLAFLRHLFAVGEPLAQRLATIHNLRFYLSLIEILRNF